MGFWNINGIRNKLESGYVLSWLLKHDVIFLNETKTNVDFCVPGYKVIIGKSENANRGGVAFLIRNSLCEDITCVDVSYHEQIWVRFSFLPQVVFGGCYVPPSDSMYYTDEDFAHIQSRCIGKSDMKFVLFGDFNAKFGNAINELVSTDQHLQYLPCDTNQRKNSNGNKLLRICNDSNLLVVNNLQYGDTQIKGALTYREGSNWVSELDICIISRDCVAAVTSLQVDQCLTIPSDHAPVTVSLDCGYLKATCSSDLMTRSHQLGSHAVLDRSHPTRPVDECLRRRPVKYVDIDCDLFQHALQDHDPDDIVIDNYEEAVDHFTNVLYECAMGSKSSTKRSSFGNVLDDRWKNILNSNDDKLLWNSINWKGNICEPVYDKPPDEHFKEHLEAILNPDDVIELNPNEFQSDVHIPLLDDPICPNEVVEVIQKQIKPNKSCGPDGVPPGVFKLLPIQWLLYLTMLLNSVFLNGYPLKWTYAKLNMLFKKGDKTQCDNYRGISIINSISKIYDYILCNRLTKWFTPDREQAGAQQKRGCTEHLVTLRLIMNYCCVRRLKLYVAYIDFSKAYDRVPRNKLMHSLKRLGCGFVMLCALISMYKITNSIMGMAVISAIVGVRQGSPTSCFLFVMYVNDLIRNLKEKCAPDGFLKCLHVLMLMDDTVILATSRERLIDKLNILNDFCDTYGMIMNESKTKFMVINGSQHDKLSLRIGDIVIQHCDQYVYLGSVFTADGSTLSSLRAQVADKIKHFHKLVLFLRKNCDIPFIVKKKVVDAAFNAALLYGSESWLDVNVKIVEKLYVGAIKNLLGVRITTPTNMCLVELGIPPLLALVKANQHRFFSKMISERQNMRDDPLMFAMELTRDGNEKMSRYITNLLANDTYISDAQNDLRSKISDSTGTKFRSYIGINPLLNVHDVYAMTLPEFARLSFTRLRLSSHNLRIETGRWSRIPRERRLCQCGAIQDEKHVLVDCPLTEPIRVRYDMHVISYPEIVINAHNDADLKFIHDIVTFFH